MKGLIDLNGRALLTVEVRATQDAPALPLEAWIARDQAVLAARRRSAEVRGCADLLLRLNGPPHQAGRRLSGQFSLSMGVRPFAVSLASGRPASASQLPSIR